jgi:L-lactate dehydrogenase
MKISIFGIGHVGATLAYTLMLKDLANELLLIDRWPEKAHSDAQDLTHALTFTDHIIPIKGGEIADSKASDIIIITASVPWRQEFTSRFDLAPGNLSLFNEAIPQLATYSPNAILIVLTNPLDIMTYFAIKASGFASGRVLGVGTLIDSARFRKLLSEKYHIHPDDIRAYILGEHGDTQFPAISAAYTGGVKIDDSSELRKLLEDSESSAYNIVKGKGYTNYAIAMATSLVVESIVKDENRTMPISTLLEGFLGVNDVCLSVPVVVGRKGITKRLNIILDEHEQGLFKKSANRVKREMDKLVLSKE